jgi:LacI family transcriptional regulator
MANRPLQRHQGGSREIALAVRVGVPHLERVVHGIRQYAAQRARWRFLINPESHDLQPVSLRGWKGDGVIALCNTNADQRVLRTLRCPVVNISGARRRSAFPRVRNDYREIGRCGAAYLRGRGFRRLGFYGVKDLWYSEEIEAGFAGFAGTNGIPVRALHAENPLESVPRWNRGQETLEKWLLKMQPPFAVMAAHDPRAAMVIRACERVGLDVPGDVAVIGANDDTVTCETCHPRLTSIDRNGFEVGWCAALTLDQMMRGRPVAGEVVIQPGDVRERESTQSLAVERPELASALRYVGRNHSEPIGVDQIAEACGKSRRWLEDAFRCELNCSPSEFLQRHRVAAAVARLESDEHLTLSQIAHHCGFSGSRQLNAALRRVHGCTAREYMTRSAQ